MKKSVNKSLLIICEGEHTEPLFFNSIKEEIKKGTYNILPIEITIKPEPIVEDSEEDEVVNSIKIKRKPQALRKAIKSEPFEIKGQPPLKWVDYGQEELRDGTYEEVWVVFDRDNHPARKEAFDKANEEVKGNRVNIAFSSRSFEYYLLLNFEQLYHRFEKTDCKTTGKNKKIIHCGTGSNKDDCNGTACINGYAFVKKYWDNSKGTESLYPIVKDKLEYGFANSIWLRAQSETHEPDIPIYDRNPFVTTDSLIKRLTGHFWEWLGNGSTIQLKQLNVQLENSLCLVTNTSNQAVIIPANSFIQIPFIAIQKAMPKKFGSRMVLDPNETFTVDLSEIKFDFDSYFIFRLEGQNIMFSN